MEPDKASEQGESTPGDPQETQPTAEQPVISDGSWLPAEHVQPGSWNAVITILLVAAVVSYIVRRLARIAATRGYRRWFPVAYAIIWGVAITAITMIYAQGLSSNWILIIWLLFLVLVFASVGWLRSVMSGVALAVEDRISLGDSLRVDSMEGEVIAFGLRSVRLRAVDGTIHEIPNEMFVKEAVSNLSAEGGDSAVEIIIKVPPSIEPDRALTLARDASLLSPFASPHFEPEVFLDTTGEFDESFEVRIRGFVFDAAYADHFRSDVVSRLHDDFVALIGPPDESGPAAQTSDRILLTEE